ncbi:MAG: 2-C-methyl-D-erythritol 4-phosphate cytidylyltransferase, partial [Cyanobacteria bacterium P01_A01_bin.135]
MHLLIPAAGRGRRMGSDRNKLLLPLMGRPVLAWTLQTADRCPDIEWIGVISQPHDWPDIKQILSDLSLTTPVELIQGGETRQDSVFNGLAALPTKATHVLIHDGARCLATPALFTRCAQALQSCAGLIAAVPVKDTIKVATLENQVESTPDRQHLWAAQTPQGFEVAQLKQCHQQGRKQQWAVTDDAALFERCGLPVQIVMGEEANLKITTPMDLAIATFILQNRDSDGSE